MRIRALALMLLLAVVAGATTLEQLTLGDMIAKSTAVVRATVVGSRTANHGGTIYTFYRLQVSENLKGSTPTGAEVAVPGGSLGRLFQTVAGAPALTPGGDYVLFLWTGKSGITQIIGLSQGAFDVKKEPTGQVVLARPPISETMLDSSGRAVSDRGATMSLSDLRARFRQGGLQ
jgi:hypothetical protein